MVTKIVKWEKQYRRIRDTSLRVQLAGNPSTNNVLLASGGRGTSGLTPPNSMVLLLAATGSDPTVPITRGPSIERLPTPLLMDLAESPPAYEEVC